ncbi:tyrosylprotein sulfotransferase [Euphorbia peplus]|nr:tyrosylprotein sulfotransferase [Euphorbia peplus]
MHLTLGFVLLFLLLGLGCVSAIRNDFDRCEKIVKQWAFASLEQEIVDDKHTLQDLLFFLHVPRTGGRTYFHCFLRKLYSSSQECPRSYDKLRFDPSKQQCRLLVTHDDYSMMSKLPRERTSVVTILRNPVDRVFKMSKRLRPRNGVSTLDIWPWKYLVPWMREDLFARRDDTKLIGSNHMKSKTPYNMEEIVMPLHEYINDPIAHDIIHNGATFQVAGLTNNSYSMESHEVRHCVQKYKILGEHVLRVAKRRLDEMLYVGLTEDHRESATMFANVVGAQVIAQALALNSSMEAEAENKLEQSTSIADSESGNDDHESSTKDLKASRIASTEDLDEKKENMTVKKLMHAYEGCISSLRKTQTRRRIVSLKRIAPANFSKEDRKHVPDVVLEQIKILNNLDVELYKYAQEIFSKQHRHMQQNQADTEGMEEVDNSGGLTSERGISLAICIVLLVLIVLFVNARRRTSKVKI